MSRQKVWFSKIVQIPAPSERLGSATTRSANMTKRIMQAKKLVLTHYSGFQPPGAPESSRWVGYSTSIGGLNLGAAINGDLWVPSGSDIWNAVESWSDGDGATNTPHPWCILKAPAGFAPDSGIESPENSFYMNISKGTSTLEDTPMELTFGYREPSRTDTVYRSPMFSSYINGTISSDPYAWGYSDSGSSSSRTYKANYGASWSHSFGASGLKDIKMLISLASDGSYIMALFEPGPVNLINATYKALNGVCYLEACIKVPSSLSTGFQTMKPTHTVFTISNVIRSQSGTASDFGVEYPHHQSLTGKYQSNNLFALGGATVSDGFHALKLATSTTTWGDNQVVKSSPAQPFGFGSYYNPIQGSTSSTASTSSTTEGRSLSNIIKTDSLDQSFLAFPYYAMLGCQIQTGATSGLAYSTPYPLCQVPDIYLSSGGFPPGEFLQSDGEYWLSFGELLIPVGSDTTLY